MLVPSILVGLSTIIMILSIRGIIIKKDSAIYIVSLLITSIVLGINITTIIEMLN